MLVSHYRKLKPAAAKPVIRCGQATVHRALPVIRSCASVLMLGAAALVLFHH